MAKEIITVEMGVDGKFSAYTTTLKSVIVGSGDTAEEAIDDFKNSLSEVIEYCEESGDGVPEELRDLTLEYQYDLTAFFDKFSFINASKLAETVGIEPSLMRRYKVGKAYISRERAKRIEQGIHKLAAELLAVKL